MPIKNSDIAQRIKGIRELSGYSAYALAYELGMSTAEYEEYESGTKDIPVSFLFDLCGLLKIGMTELLTGDKARLHSYSIVRKGKGLDVERISAYKYQNLAYPFANRKLEPFLVTIEPSADNEPFHLNSHNGQEYHFCLEGKLIVQIGEHTVEVNEGDSLYFDSNQKHGMKVLGGASAKILVIVI